MKKIQHYGGINIALLGIGNYDNVAFNGLGSRPNSQGTAFFNNIVGGTISIWNSTDRYTTYHYPHSTKIKEF